MGYDPALVQVVFLGRLGYAQALEKQLERHQALVDSRQGPCLFLVEHPPVITVSQRKQAPGNVLANPQELHRLGVQVCQTDRGGDVTYHGPGQAVVYPILRLSDYGLNLSTYMHLLEVGVQAYLAGLGIESYTDPKAIGVWVRQPGRSDAKVCALGVRIARNVTLHGLALNVHTDLTHFGLIVPCGIQDRGVTSLREILQDRCPSLEEAHQGLADTLAAMLRGRAITRRDGANASSV